MGTRLVSVDPPPRTILAVETVATALNRMGQDMAGLISRGRYSAIVTNILEPRQNESNNFFRVGIELDIDGHKGFAYAIGTMDTVVMIYRARKHWIDMKVHVDVDVRVFNDRKMNHFRVIWPEDQVGWRD